MASQQPQLRLFAFILLAGGILDLRGTKVSFVRLISLGFFLVFKLLSILVFKYFKAIYALIFWMGLYFLICKPVPTTTAFQKRCQIYYKGELEQNSSLAMHHGHYANTTREHIS